MNRKDLKDVFELANYSTKLGADTEAAQIAMYLRRRALEFDWSAQKALELLADEVDCGLHRD